MARDAVGSTVIGRDLSFKMCDCKSLSEIDRSYEVAATCIAGGLAADTYEKEGYDNKNCHQTTMVCRSCDLYVSGKHSGKPNMCYILNGLK